MRKDIVVGVDIAKRFMQVCVMSRTDGILKESKVARGKFVSWLEVYKDCEIVMEACGGAHPLGRMLQGLGFEVKLLHPAHVKPFVGVQKNDRVDARAICEAAMRPAIHPVPVKSLGQQDLRTLQRVRQGVVRDRTRSINQLRGLLGEYGLLLPKGAEGFLRRLRELMAGEAWREELSADIQDLFAVMAEELDRLFVRERNLLKRIEHLQSTDPVAQRLRSIPGVGPVIAAEVMGSIEDASIFRTSRGLSSWIGLVPRQNSTGGKTRLGGITKRGQPELRRLLVQGSRSIVNAAKRHEGAPRHHLEAFVLAHQGKLKPNVLAIAVANKMARTIWAVMAREEDFRSTLQVRVHESA